MLKRFIHVILLYLLPMAGFSQKVWSLEECIVYAGQNNLQLKMADNNIRVSRQNVILSKGGILPVVNGSSALNYNLGRVIDPFTNQYSNSHITSNNLSLNGSLTLFNGFQVYNTIRQNESSYQASKTDYQRIKNDISLNIASAYLQILMNEEMLNTAKNQLEITQIQFARTEKLSEAGKVSASILFDLTAQMALEESQLVGAENQLQVSYLVLKQLMNFIEVGDFRIVKPENLLIAETSLPPEDEIYKTAIETLPQVKVSEYNRQSNLYAVKVAKGKMSPRLALNSSISTLFASSNKKVTGYTLEGSRVVGYTKSTGDSVLTPVLQPISSLKPYTNQLHDNINKSIGLSLSIPILNGLQTKTSIHKAQINYESSDYDMQLTLQNIRKSVQRAYLDATLSLKQYHAMAKASDAQQQAFKNSEKRLEVGLIEGFEYNQVKYRFTNAQSDLLRAKYDYLFKTKILDFYRGIPLKL
jgi:outer membrane protein